MPWSLISSLMRCAVAQGLAMALTLTGVAAAVPTGPAPRAPAAVRQTLADAAVSGQGELRFLGLHVYDARLWVAPGFEAETFERHPLALELRYYRAFRGAVIAQRSLEEIHQQARVAPAQAQHWDPLLAQVLPDVQAGDVLTGLYLPGQGLQLWRGDQRLGSVEDAELARRFFGIWLSPRTSQPALRRALLGQQAPEAP
ncbi:MAG TPA: hypothetical protein DIC45_09360 [Comamonadaceae bacterium]|nr:hypothetical protein [Comamonadaceae bacterium]